MPPACGVHRIRLVDCLKLLKDEHDEVKALFKKIEKAEGNDAARLWADIKSRLTLHEELEETLFYPQLKKDDTTNDIVLEAYQEHHVMDLLIGEISALKPSAEEWHPKVTVLMENTEHHIEEEEGELFPKVRKIWDTDKREQVGRKMQEMKDRRLKERQAA
jgi:hemerythrin superfamily protein